ncbi:MAG: hypothetical protein ACE5FG_15575, partial [Myxococcota bacterium]
MHRPPARRCGPLARGRLCGVALSLALVAIGTPAASAASITIDSFEDGDFVIAYPTSPTIPNVIFNQPTSVAIGGIRTIVI